MIGISKLYCDESFGHDPLRYGEETTDARAKEHSHKLQKKASERKPIVVWNVTRTCNLKCIHCYTNSENRKYKNELTTEEGIKLIDDLTEFEVPVLLFSGGEPFIRKDIFTLAEYAVHKKLRVVFSTNGTLITDKIADRLQSIGIIYIGISLDGMSSTNDKFRGQVGAFNKTLNAIRECKKRGMRISLRLTLTRHNMNDIENIFKLVEDENIDRVCFYHLAYSGRGKNISSDDLQLEETRKALDTILEYSKSFQKRGLYKDILTVDNHADGVYLYLKLLKENPERAEKVRKLLEWNGGGANSSGVGISDIDPEGYVHADQFWMDYSFGNVRDRKFGDIWMDTSDPLMAGLKNRLPLLKGRCGKCKWQKMCGGSLRVRAKFVYGDPWAQDPACYLTDKEIGII